MTGSEFWAGKRVLVTGGGPVGLLTTAVLRSRGVTDIVVFGGLRKDRLPGGIEEVAIAIGPVEGVEQRAVQGARTEGANGSDVFVAPVFERVRPEVP